MNDLDVIMCCLPKNLPIARLAINGVRKHVSSGKIFIATHPNAFEECRRVLGRKVELIDESEISGEMTIEQLRQLPVEGFPSRAGWYLQQMAKLGYARRNSSDEHYLIWDCDTVPLRKLDLFAADGSPMYTMSDERHFPYWDTYEGIFGYKPDYIGSFISQHMVVNRHIAREMLAEIETRNPNERSWSWAIMKHLAPVKSLSLFSEYETYGYYCSIKHPKKIKFRRLPWLRDGALQTINPKSRQLKRLSRKYYFAAFESWQFEQARNQMISTKVRHKLKRVTGRLLKLIGF